jgi:hypothetical protein
VDGRLESFATEMLCSCYVRSSPDSDHIADAQTGCKSATSRHQAGLAALGVGLNSTELPQSHKSPKANLPIAQGRLRRVQHLRDREEIAVRTHLTIKYEFILWSDLPEFACRAECHYMLARYDRCTATRSIECRSAFGRAQNWMRVGSERPFDHWHDFHFSTVPAGSIRI